MPRIARLSLCIEDRRRRSHLPSKASPFWNSWQLNVESWPIGQRARAASVPAFLERTMFAGNTDLDHGEDGFELAEKLLAKSRDRLKQLQALEGLFVSGSPERMRANILLQEVEVLHDVLKQLYYQIRRSRSH
jgi:hypothetical protein